MTNTPDNDKQEYSIQEVKLIIDSYLRGYFELKKVQAATVSTRYEQLWMTAEMLSLAGGKRIRPYMVLLAYRSFADNDIDKIIPAAVASELKHIAMLIHDDIIDRDDTRYGIANITGQYLSEYKDLSPTDQRHFANSAALLMGDVLLSEAHHLLSTVSDDLVRLRNAQSVFSTAILHVIGGELIDTEASIRPIEDSHAITVARYKTASYSFIGPLSVGAHLAGADQADVDTLVQYADSLGIAFQLKDDLLGTFGNSDNTGKSSDTDLREGKRTYIIEQFDQKANLEDKTEFYSLFGTQDLTDQQASRLRQLLIKNGAVEKTETIIHEYATKAKEVLSSLQIKNDHKQEFIDLISSCINRDK